MQTEHRQAPPPWTPYQPRDHRSPWLIAFAAAALLFGLVLTVMTAGLWLDRSAYLSGRPCAQAFGGDCVTDVRAMVSTEPAQLDLGAERQYSVSVVYADQGGGQPRLLLFGREEVAARALRPGQQVTVRFWGAQPARVEAPGIGTAETDRSPVNEVWPRALDALLALAAGGTLLVVGLWGRLRLAGSALLAVAVGALFAAAALDLSGAAGWPVLGLFAGGVALAVAVVALVSRTGRATSARTPLASPPAAR